MRVVGCGGGSYLGLSFYEMNVSFVLSGEATSCMGDACEGPAAAEITYLVFFVLVVASGASSSTTGLLITLYIVSVTPPGFLAGGKLTMILAQRKLRIYGYKAYR